MKATSRNEVDLKKNEDDPKNNVDIKKDYLILTGSLLLTVQLVVPLYRVPD